MNDGRIERESIWSVPTSWRDLYLALFAFQVLICTGLVAWYEVSFRTGDNPLETFIAIGNGSSPFVILVAAETVFLVEVFRMLSERYLQRRFKEGRAEGQAEEYRRWEAWNNRRLAAEARGELFTEPPPSLDRANGTPPPRQD